MVSEPATRGRKRDASRDGDILDAALEVLGESGYTGMTIEAVAARVGAGRGTLYRRWPSKAELALDAVARLNAESMDAGDLPDTGSLVGDLRALVKVQREIDDARRLRIMIGLTPMFADDSAVATAANAAIAAPWVEVNRVLLQRAVDRGEIRADTDVETFAALIPNLAVFRACVQRLPTPTSYFEMLTETVLLPALGLDDRQR